MGLDPEILPEELRAKYAEEIGEPIRKPRDEVESRLQRATARLVELLKEEGAIRHPKLVFHVPMERLGRVGRKKMKGYGAEPGVPDWFLSRDYVVELKAPKGRLSPAQRAFRDQWSNSGGTYLVARSMHEFAQALWRSEILVKDGLGRFTVQAKQEIEMKWGLVP